MLEVRPALGRGRSYRQPGATVLTYLSPWEEAWLVVDQMKSAGRLRSPMMAATELQAELRTSLVNAISITILCLETPTEGHELVKAVAVDPSSPAHDRAWLRWLADGSDDALAAGLTEDLAGETPMQPLIAALRGNWAQVETLLPKSFRKPFAKPVQPSGTRMHGQFLAQLASYALRGEPSRDVLDASLAALFGFFGFDKTSAWWDGQDVMTRLPLLALYARELQLTSAGALLLHAQRRLNSHLTEPPARSFFGPPDVIAAVEKLERVLATAAAERRGLSGSLEEDGNVYVVS
ncbi:MAG: hypothetical protein JWP01_2049 [Myxococcales bacterium]|nr:hypothetical protein [Myxococcales bacterium]